MFNMLSSSRNASISFYSLNRLMHINNNFDAKTIEHIVIIHFFNKCIKILYT